MPFNTLVILAWDGARFLVDASTCPQEGGIEFLVCVAESRPVIVAVFGKGFLLAGIGSQGKIKDMIANFSRNTIEKRRVVLWVGIGCAD